MSNHPGEARSPTDGGNSNGKKVGVGIVGCGEAAQILHWPSLYQLADHNGRGGVTHLESHPTWGDPFVAEWKSFHANITNNQAPKTGPTDFMRDLELFIEMAHLMRAS